MGKSNQISSCTSNVANHLVSFFKGKIDRNELSADQFQDSFGTNWKDFAYDIPSGRRPLRLEYLCIAKNLYNYSVSAAFGEDSFNIGVVNEDPGTYNAELFNKSLVKHISDKLDGWFKKHKTQKKGYAEARLDKSRQALHANLTGGHRLYADELITIAQDLGESLDDLRSVPLPKGHFLMQMQLQQQIIEQQQAQIELLKKQSKK